MKRIATILALPALLMGSAFAQSENQENQAAFIRTPRPDVYKLIVDTKEKSTTTFNIYDEEGKKLFTDRVHKRKGFTRNYNFKDIPDGLYKLEVEKSGRILTQNLEHEKGYRSFSQPALFVDLSREAGSDKVNLKVQGAKSRKVLVTIKDVGGQVLYTDRITGLKGFTRTYDVARLGKDVAFEVKVDNNLITKNL